MKTLKMKCSSCSKIWDVYSDNNQLTDIAGNVSYHNIHCSDIYNTNSKNGQKCD